MRENLRGNDRLSFYRALIKISLDHDARAFVVVSDTTCRYAIPSSIDHEHDVTSLFLERANLSLISTGNEGVVVIASPGGGPRQEGKFIANCIDILKEGTDYADFKYIPLPVMTAKSRHIRLLQLADVIASCTTNRVAGEPTYSPAVFDLIKPMFRKELNRIGGVGLKIHPDFRYANLYYWLLDDASLVRGNSGLPLPIRYWPYYNHPGE